MNPSLASSDLKQLRYTVSLQRYTILGLAAAVLLCVIGLVSSSNRMRVVLIPPTIDKTFWVEHNQVSASYLEQMAAFISYLILDVSPGSVDWKRGLLQQYVTESSAGELEQRQVEQAAELKKINATTQFSIQGVESDSKRMAVRLRGSLATYINGSRISEERKTFLATFAYSGGRIHLSKFEEVQEKR